jgi:hypothetical protein
VSLRHSPGALDSGSRNLTLARILEEGDRADLAWLAREAGREAIVTFVRELSGRKLSARSRRFWCRAFGISEAEPPRHPLAEQLWPLA